MDPLLICGVTGRVPSRSVLIGFGRSIILLFNFVYYFGDEVYAWAEACSGEEFSERRLSC